MNLAMTCTACGLRFEGPPEYLRSTIWPHSKTHDISEFETTERGEVSMFAGDEFILSCNCGECDFCRKKALS